MEHFNQIIHAALKEDEAHRDITSSLLIPRDHRSTAHIILKEKGVLCGIAVARQIYQRISPQLKFKSLCKDGAEVGSGRKIATITGSTRAILRGERTAINFLMHLSGVATLTRQFVKKAGNPKVDILDTRKTIPGLRELEKYAVRCGGGVNHRMNLADMVLIKDNHLAAVKHTRSIADIVRQTKQRTKKPVEIEVTSLKEFRHACQAGPDVILLDNMKPSCIKDAVVYLRHHKRSPKILLEASGGINLKNIKKIAQTGVDRISIGALTHSAKAINMSLEIGHVISKGTTHENK